jgi:hypothetical protein
MVSALVLPINMNTACRQHAAAAVVSISQVLPNAQQQHLQCAAGASVPPNVFEYRAMSQQCCMMLCACALQSHSCRNMQGVGCKTYTAALPWGRDTPWVLLRLTRLSMRAVKALASSTGGLNTNTLAAWMRGSSTATASSSKQQRAATTKLNCQVPAMHLKTPVAAGLSMDGRWATAAPPADTATASE